MPVRLHADPYRSRGRSFPATPMPEPANPPPSPTFDAPPVVERALAVQFEELDGFGLIHYGLWFEEIEEALGFSEHREAARLPRIAESFPFRPSPDLFELSNNPRGLLAARTADRVWQMQVQPDRLSLIWQRADGAGGYPPFDDGDAAGGGAANSVAARFWDLWARFGRFCETRGICAAGGPDPDLCEVTYVNRLPTPAETPPADDFGQILGTSLEGPGGPQPGREPVHWAYDRAFDFPADRVRLYAEASAAFARGAGPTPAASVLRLIGRAMIGDEDSPPERLRAAHDHVVKGFVDLTERSVRQSRWEQKA